MSARLIDGGSAILDRAEGLAGMAANITYVMQAWGLGPFGN
ncbi:hypothetical protein [Nocardia stercoris]|nr:hypothetical protein [Nocardia stercoris]